MGTPRPPRPNNVVALSQYRARLGRGRKLRRADALLEAPDLEAAVRALPGDELYYVLHEIGLAEGADILASATSEQLAIMLDFAIWERDQLNPAAYSEWLSAIAAAPFERIGRWMKGIDSELLGLILRHKDEFWHGGETDIKDRITRSIDFMEEHVREPLSVATLAAVVNLSRPTRARIHQE